MKIYKWCEYSTDKGDWIRTHEKFLRPDDIAFLEDAATHQYFKVVSMPYIIPASLEYTIDLQPIDGKENNLQFNEMVIK